MAAELQPIFLECKSCYRELHYLEFYADKKARHRGYRGYECKKCTYERRHASRFEQASVAVPEVMSTDAIAKELGVSHSEIHRLQAQAMRKLREAFAQRGISAADLLEA